MKTYTQWILPLLAAANAVLFDLDTGRWTTNAHFAISAPTQPASTATSRDGSPVLGPAVELVIPHLPAAGDNAVLFDLDARRWTTYAHFAMGPDAPAPQREWLRRTGADLAATPDSQYPILIGYDMVFCPAEARSWESLTAADILNSEALRVNESDESSFADKSEGRPDTYFFRTRQGGTGILQVLGNSANPPGVRMRYEMLQHNGAKVVTKVFSLRHGQASNVVDFLRQRASAGCTFLADAPKNAVIVSALETEFPAIQQMFLQLDVPK